MYKVQSTVKAAFVGFGEVNSPQQLIKDKCLMGSGGVKSLGIEVVTTGHVTDDPGAIDVKSCN